jgi:hypothetical protein
VVKLYGEAGLRNRSDNWLDSETMTVYPDINPTGTDMPSLAPETLQTPPGTPGVPQPPVPGAVQDAPSSDTNLPVIESPGRQPNYLPDPKPVRPGSVPTPPDPRQSRLVPTPATRKAAATVTTGPAAQAAVYNSVDVSTAGGAQRLPSSSTTR